MLRRTTLSTNLLAGALLFASSAFAQIPGGGTPAGQTPSTVPIQRPDSNTPTPVDNPTNPAPSKVDDKQFVKQAAVGGMAEVALGKLAVQKASSNDVKQFAQKMIDDHTNANHQLKQVATRDNIAIPDSLDSKHQAEITKLSKLSGEAFDKAYIKNQLKDHKTDVAMFNAESQNGSDPRVKAFASSTLPTLKEHLELVKNLHKAQKS